MISVRQRSADDLLSACLHAFGFVLAVGVGVQILLRWATQEEVSGLIGLSVFAVGAAVLFFSSVMCHTAIGPAQILWQRLDHSAALVLIPASYAPFALASPWASSGLYSLALLAIAAFLGSLWQVRSSKATPSLMLYLALGWTSVCAAIPVSLWYGVATTLWLLVGAGCYTAGTFFYRNSLRWRHAHSAWHAFVLAGCGAHYASTRQLISS